MTHTKSEWRRRLLAARRQLDEATRRAASATIAVRVAALPEFVASRTVLTYLPLGAEVDPTAIGEAARAAGKALYHVTVVGERAGWVPADAGRAGSTGRLPRSGPACVIVPGVAFDPSGKRLGRGGGFYDRALADLRAAGAIQAVGVAFEMQIVPALPEDAWDEAVDVVVTECRALVPERAAPAEKLERHEGGDRCK